jgi:intracellular multiplication protein IcmV
MAIRDIFKLNRKTFFDPLGWIDHDGLKSYTRTIWDILATTFSTPRPVREESFEAAMKRLNLTAKDVKSGANLYRLTAIIFLILAIITFIYSFYLLFHRHTFPGWLLGMATTALFLSQAFKFDFWAFQMRERKLGLTYAQWSNSILGNKKGPSS